MPYVQKTWETPRTREVLKYYRFACTMENGKIQKSREKRQKASTETKQRWNRKQRIRKFTRKMDANFGIGDYNYRFSYPLHGRPTAEEHNKIWSRFLRKLRDAYRRAGKVFRWMTRTEIGTRGGIHVHMVLSAGISRDEIDAMWQTFGGVCRSQRLYSRELGKLAMYMLKDEQEIAGRKQKYSCSRNLIIPQAKTKKVKATSWMEVPREPAGWMMVADSIETGVNPFTGYGYQYVKFVKITDKGDEDDEKANL